MEKSNLEDVFNRPFMDAKANWKAYCPFHDERTPSFFVHKQYLIANCYGCGVSGYIDTLAAHYLSTDVSRARELLAIDLQEAARRNISREAEGPSYFPESWLSPWKKEVHKYVIGRGFSADILRKAGSRYDRATKRQVFPHFDRRQRLLGAVGRACEGQEPKWYFYWGYNKGKALYSPFKGERTKSLRPTFVVEGVFDLLWAYQHGVENVVALLGSKATIFQRSELRSLPRDIVLMLDNDSAGIEGAKRLLSSLKQTKRVSFWNYEVHEKDTMSITDFGRELLSPVQWKNKYETFVNA